MGQYYQDSAYFPNIIQAITTNHYFHPNEKLFIYICTSGLIKSLNLEIESKSNYIF